MTCDQATFLLERRWDHALSGDEEHSLDVHLRECAVCQAEAEAIAVADAMFVRMPDIEPPVDIAAAVARRIAEEAPAEPRRGWIWAGLLALATLVAALWHSGLTPAVLWADPAVTAVVAPLTHTASVWLRPVTMTLQALSPAIGSLAAWLGVILALEMGMLGLWMLRTKRRGGAGQAVGRA